MSASSVTAGRERLVEVLLFQCAARASREPSSRCPAVMRVERMGPVAARHSPQGPARLEIRRYTLSPSHDADEVDLPPPTTRMMTWPVVSVKPRPHLCVHIIEHRLSDFNAALPNGSAKRCQ